MALYSSIGRVKDRRRQPGGVGEGGPRAVFRLESTMSQVQYEHVPEGAPFWLNTGEQGVIDSRPSYPTFIGHVNGKALPGEGLKSADQSFTTDESLGLKWVKDVGYKLLPSRLWTGLAQWAIRWAPLKEKLDNAKDVHQASKAVEEIKETRNLSGLAKDAATSAAHPIDSLKYTNEATKELAKDAGDVASKIGISIWDSIPWYVKVGGAALGGLIVWDKVK